MLKTIKIEITKFSTKYYFTDTSCCFNLTFLQMSIGRQKQYITYTGNVVKSFIIKNYISLKKQVDIDTSLAEHGDSPLEN